MTAYSTTVHNVSEALAVLQMVAAGGRVIGSDEARAIHAVCAWLRAREDEVDDIKHGAASILLQCAQQRGHMLRTGGPSLYGDGD